MGATWIERETDGEAQKHMWNFARTIQKKVILASYRYWGWKVVFFGNPKRKKSWVDPGAPSTSTARSNRFGRKTMLCVWWDQKGVVYYELLKPGETVNTKRYQQQLIDLNRFLFKKRPEYQKRPHKVIFSMTMLHHIRQNQFGTRWKHSAGKFYPMWLTYQTWLLPIITCLHRWVTCWAALWFAKMWKNGSMNGSWQKGKIFTDVVFTNCPKDGKNV